MKKYYTYVTSGYHSRYYYFIHGFVKVYNKYRLLTVEDTKHLYFNCSFDTNQLDNNIDFSLMVKTLEIISKLKRHQPEQ